MIKQSKTLVTQGSDVVKADGEYLATPGCLMEDRVGMYANSRVGDSESWVRALWIACEETPGPERFPRANIDWIWCSLRLLLEPVV